MSYFREVLFSLVFMLYVTISAQVPIVHPPDTVNVKSLGRSALVEWVFEQPDTMLRYSNGVPAGIWTYGLDKALGVVFDLSDYPDATLEEIDFVHYSTELIPGDLYYNIIVLDMINNTVIEVIDSLEAANSYNYPQYEVAVPLGSISYLQKAGIFIQGLSNKPPSNLYFPCPMTDDQTLVSGTSYWCNDTNDPFNNNLYELNLLSASSTNLNISLWINLPVETNIASTKRKIDAESKNLSPFGEKEVLISNTHFNGWLSDFPSTNPIHLSQQGKGFNIYRSVEDDSLELIGTVDFDARSFEDSAPKTGEEYVYAVSAFEDSSESRRIRAGYTHPAIQTIAEAKIDQNGDFIPDQIDQILGVVGIISTPNFSTQCQYFIQDHSAGIMLFSDDFSVQFKEGDSIYVLGQITQINGQTAIIPDEEADIIFLNTNNPIDTLTLSMRDVNENYESLLVKFENVHLVNPEFWPMAGNDGSAVQVSDGNDTITIFIDKDTELPGWSPPQGQLNLVGVIDQYTRNVPANDGYRIRPRYQSDFILLTSIPEQPMAKPLQFALNQNYPNPFNPVTNITFSLPEAGQVNLTIYNFLGQRVAELVSAQFPAGLHQIVFDAGQFSSGVYIYQLSCDGYTASRKMIVLR